MLLGQSGFAVENAKLLKQARAAADALKEVVEQQVLELNDAHYQNL